MAKTRRVTATYSFYTEEEGGPSKRDVMDDLKFAGFVAKSCGSPYLGQTGVVVENVRQSDKPKIERIIFGRPF